MLQDSKLVLSCSLNTQCLEQSWMLAGAQWVLLTGRVDRYDKGQPEDQRGQLGSDPMARDQMGIQGSQWVSVWRVTAN